MIQKLCHALFCLPLKANKSLKLKNVSTYFQIFAWVSPLVIHSLEYYSQAALMAVISMNEHFLLMTGS